MNLRFQGELFNPILAVGVSLVLFLMPTLLFQTMAQNIEPETEQVYPVGRLEVVETVLGQKELVSSWDTGRVSEDNMDF